MLFSDLNLKTKTLKIIGLSFTLAGILFILASKYIGSFAIRLVMVFILLFSAANIKKTYRYMATKEKLNYFLAVSASILGLFKPELTMFIMGIFLLFLTVPPYINAIKTKDYSDVVALVISGAGILFAFYCVINSKAALNTVIIIIGIILTVTGCLALYETFLRKKSDTEKKESGFEDNSTPYL